MERPHIHSANQRLSSSQGFPGGSDGKESACGAGDQGPIPGSGRCSGEGHGNPLQYHGQRSLAAVHGITKCRTRLTLFSSVTQSCPTLCDPMDYSMPGFPVHHQLPEFTQTHVHQVGDAIQPSPPLLSPSPPAFNLSQHEGLFQ